MMFLLTITNDGRQYSKALVFADSSTKALEYAVQQRDELQAFTPNWETTFSLNVVGEGSEIVANDPVLADVDYIKSL